MFNPSQKKETLTLRSFISNQVAKAEPDEIVPNEMVPEASTMETSPYDAEWSRDLLAGRSFTQDLEAARLPEKDRLYYGWADKRDYSLSQAYPLYLHLLADPDNVTVLLSEEYFRLFPPRNRQPPVAQLALLALKFVTRPTSPEDIKSCSAYSTMLKYAHVNKVRPEAFGAEMKHVTLRNARKSARKPKARTLVPKLKLEFQKDTEIIKREISLSCSLSITEDFCSEIVVAVAKLLEQGSVGTVSP